MIPGSWSRSGSCLFLVALVACSDGSTDGAFPGQVHAPGAYDSFAFRFLP